MTSTPTYPGSFRSSRAQRGMTVLELLITLAVVGFLVIIGYNGVRHVRESDLREDATQIAAVLRAAYNMATLSGVHHRVVFDLDEQTYKIEACEGEVALRLREREEVLESGDAEDVEEMVRAARSSLPPQLAQAMSPEEAAQTAAALAGTRVGAARCKPPELPTGDADGRGAERQVRADRGIEIRHMFVQHLEGEQSSGLVRVNFFPLGRAEKAVIEVGAVDDLDSAYTLLVHGLTGRVEFRAGRIDADEHMMRRADGERVDER